MANKSGPDPVSADQSARRGIQSLEIGLGILQAIARGSGPMTLKEIAAASDLPASNCHRYLVSFARSGFVVQNARTSRYDLGPALLQAGIAALARVDAIGIATEALEHLVDETGHTGMVVIWAEAGPTIVRWIQGRQAVRTTLAPGAILPLLTTATGQLFLAFLPPRQTAQLMPGAPAADVAALRDRVRAAGWAQVSGDHIPGLAAAAAPVLDSFGEAVAVLTLVSAGQPVSPAALDALRLHAAAASARMGAPVVDIDPVLDGAAPLKGKP